VDAFEVCREDWGFIGSIDVEVLKRVLQPYKNYEWVAVKVGEEGLQILGERPREEQWGVQLITKVDKGLFREWCLQCGCLEVTFDGGNLLKLVCNVFPHSLVTLFFGGEYPLKLLFSPSEHLTCVYWLAPVLLR
jgi:hypothetical protein